MFHLSEKGPVEGDGEEAVYCPHGNVQVHQEPLLFQSVDCSSDPLGAETSWAERRPRTNTCRFQAQIPKPLA